MEGKVFGGVISFPEEIRFKKRLFSSNSSLKEMNFKKPTSFQVIH